MHHIKGKIPFINFFDGFRTSHEIQKIETWDYEDLKDMADMDAIDAFRKTCTEPEPSVSERFCSEPGYLLPGSERHATRTTMLLPAIVQEYMDKVNAKIGTDYKLFNYYGAADAEQRYHRYGFCL